MRRIGFALLVVAFTCAMFAIVQAAHKGISELHPRTYTVFRDPSDGSVISTGYVMCYESEWDTAQASANDPTYAYLFIRTGSGNATYFYHDDMPQDNCLTCYHIDGATVVCCAESLQFKGKALADSALTSWTQIKANAITRACLDGGENYAWHTEIADSNFFVPADTVWVNALLATHTWVLEQGYAVSGATAATVEFMNDAIWGDTYPVAAGQASSTVDVVYDDAANTVTLNLANESVTSAQVDDLSLHARELMYSETYGPSDKDFAVARWHDPYYKIAWRSLEDFVEDGDDLIWGTPTGSYLYRLDYNGSGGASQAQIMEWAADLFDQGQVFSGLTLAESGSGDTRQIDIDVHNVTSSMIFNETIQPLDLSNGAGESTWDIPVWATAGSAFGWHTLNNIRDNATDQKEDFQDDVAEFIIGDTDGIIITYDDPNNEVDWEVSVAAGNIQNFQVNTSKLADAFAQGPQAQDEIFVNRSLGFGDWKLVSELIALGDGITWATASTAPTCSLSIDFASIDWPASVSTIQILVADIWRAEIDTLEAGRVTADSLTMLGTRWDDGAGKIIAAAFPDSADFASVSTVALYIDGVDYQESLEDYVGAMMTGTRGTDITVTYTDASGEIDIDADAAITRDSEWDTAAEINAAMSDDNFLLESAASISTSLHVTNVRWDNASGKIDGEQIADDTIDKDAIDTDAVDSDALKDDNTPADEDFYRYESTGSTGHWTAASEIPAMLNSSTVQVLDTNRYAESAIDPANRDSLVLAHAGVATGSTIISGWLKKPPQWNITIGKDAPYGLSVISSSADHVTIHWTPSSGTKSGGDAEMWYYVLGTPP